MIGLSLILLFSFGMLQSGIDIDYDIEGNLYVLDQGRDMVIKYTPQGDSIDAIGGFGRGDEELDTPFGIYARRGTDVFVADYNNHRVQRYDRLLNLVGSIQGENVGFRYPLDVAVSRQGDLLILDGENRRVLVLDATGNVIRRVGDLGSGKGRLVDPQQLELDGEDNIYVLDQGGLRVFDPFGGWLRQLDGVEGKPITSFSIDRDTLTTIVAGQLRFTDLKEMRGIPEMIYQMTDSTGNDLQTKTRGIRYRNAAIYCIEQNRVVIRKLPGRN